MYVCLLIYPAWVSPSFSALCFNTFHYCWTFLSYYFSNLSSSMFFLSFPCETLITCVRLFDIVLQLCMLLFVCFFISLQFLDALFFLCDCILIILLVSFQFWLPSSAVLRVSSLKSFFTFVAFSFLFFYLTLFLVFNSLLNSPFIPSYCPFCEIL